VGSGPIDLEILDLTGDNLPEILVLEHFSHSISTLRNRGVVGVPSSRPRESAPRILAAWPNPVRDRLTASFETDVQGRVLLDVIDVRGRRVAVVHEGMADRGLNTVTWDAGSSRPAPGVYFLRLSTEGQETGWKFRLLAILCGWPAVAGGA
jgi:hypothetical protein